MRPRRARRHGDGLRHERPDGQPARRRAIRARHQLPRAEGALRLLVRQGYAENRPGSRRSSAHRLQVEVRYADTPAGLRSGRRRLGLRRRLDPGRASPTPSSRTAPRARSTPLSCRSARELPRPVPRSRRGARGGTHRYGVAFLWSPRLLIWRHSLRKHAPSTWGPLAYNGKSRRGRVALEDTPLEIGDAAIALRALAADARHHRSVRARRDPVRRGAGAREATPPPRRRALARDRRRDRRLRRRARRRRRGRLVHRVGQIRAQNVDVGLTLPREGAPGEIDLWMLGAHALAPRLRLPLDALRLGRRVQAEVARFYGATPVNAGACAAARQDRPATRCTPTHPARS